MDWRTKLVDPKPRSRRDYKSLATPVYRGSTVIFDDQESVNDDWQQEKYGYSYGLYGTPTNGPMEETKPDTWAKPSALHTSNFTLKHGGDATTAKARRRKRTKCLLRGPPLREATLNRPTKVWLLVSSERSELRGDPLFPSPGPPSRSAP